MKLKVMLPTKILLEQDVSKVIAEAENGSFCLLPRHIDFVAALVPGLLFFESDEGQETFLAVNEGVLVKCGAEILVSTRDAVIGPDLGSLKETIQKAFRVLDDREKRARTAAGKLEANLVRRFLELGKHGS